MCTGCNTSSVCSAWYEFCLENAAQARITCQLQIWDHAEWARCEAPARTKRRPSDWGKKAGCSFNMHRLQQVIVLFCLVWLCFRIWLHRRMTHVWKHKDIQNKEPATPATEGAGLACQSRRKHRPSPCTTRERLFYIAQAQTIYWFVVLAMSFFYDIVAPAYAKDKINVWIKSSCSFSNTGTCKSMTHPEQSDALFMLYAQVAATIMILCCLVSFFFQKIKHRHIIYQDFMLHALVHPY